MSTVSTLAGLCLNRYSNKPHAAGRAGKHVIICSIAAARAAVDGLWRRLEIKLAFRAEALAEGNVLAAGGADKVE